jgi:hypothetical protein
LRSSIGLFDGYLARKTMWRRFGPIARAAAMHQGETAMVVRNSHRAGNKQARREVFSSSLRKNREI